MNGKWEISDVLRRSWDITKDNLGLSIGGTLVYMGILTVGYLIWYGALMGVIFGMRGDETTMLVSLGLMSTVGLLIYLLVSSYLTVGYLRMMFKLARSEAAGFGDLFSGGSGTMATFLCMVIMLVVLDIGFLLFIVPGLLLAVMWFFAYFLIADKRVGAIASLKESWGMVKGRFMDVLVWILVFSGLQILGQMAMGIGVVVSMPLGVIATIIVYDTILGGPAASAGAAAPGMPAAGPPPGGSYPGGGA